MQELKPPRVLVADDNPSNQKVILGFLELLGIQAEAVSNGDAAVKSFASGSFDLVLMDCQMPGVDGYEATRRIRALEQKTGAPHTPIIAISGEVLGDETEICRKIGMDDCLLKPVGAQVFEKTLLHWLSRCERRYEIAS
jgi:CheY-like chemotaxis protein